MVPPITNWSHSMTTILLGHHPRCGINSLLRVIPPDSLRQILELLTERFVGKDYYMTVRPDTIITSRKVEGEDLECYGTRNYSSIVNRSDRIPLKVEYNLEETIITKTPTTPGKLLWIHELIVATGSERLSVGWAPLSNGPAILVKHSVVTGFQRINTGHVLPIGLYHTIWEQGVVARETLTYRPVSRSSTTARRRKVRLSGHYDNPLGNPPENNEPGGIGESSAGPDAALRPSLFNEAQQQLWMKDKFEAYPIIGELVMIILRSMDLSPRIMERAKRTFEEIMSEGERV